MAEKVVIVDYWAGNLTSVRLAFEALGVKAQITSESAAILLADRVVFPGVGAAGAGMETLAQQLHLIDVLKTVVERGTPFLGICLGAQIILEHSEEDGGVDGIGLLPGTVERFRPLDPTVKVPQIGWNNVEITQWHPVFSGIDDEAEFYFLHSYYPAPFSRDCILAETEYAGVRFASVIGRDNIVATQFHPERSGRIGLRLLQNFSKWDGTC